MFDALMKQVLGAVASDLSNPAVAQQLRREMDHAATRMLGIDVTNPFVKPYWDRAYDDLMGKFSGFVKVSETAPVETGEFLKEKAGDAVDSFTEALKKRIAAKENDHVQ